MPKLKDLETVDADFVRTGPVQGSMTKLIGCTADELFRALEDEASWKKFLNIDVEWTSPKPFGVGTTRTVTANGQIIEEYFTDFEPGRLMAFRFDRATLPVAAFAEEWKIEPKGDEVCELQWSYAYKWGGPLEPVLSPAFNKFFKSQGKRSLDKLATLMESENPWT